MNIIVYGSAKLIAESGIETLDAFVNKSGPSYSLNIAWHKFGIVNPQFFTDFRSLFDVAIEDSAKTTSYEILTDRFTEMMRDIQQKVVDSPATIHHVFFLKGPYRLDISAPAGFQAMVQAVSASGKVPTLNGGRDRWLSVLAAKAAGDSIFYLKAPLETLRPAGEVIEQAASGSPIITKPERLGLTLDLIAFRHLEKSLDQSFAKPQNGRLNGREVLQSDGLLLSRDGLSLLLERISTSLKKLKRGKSVEIDKYPLISKDELFSLPLAAVSSTRVLPSWLLDQDVRSVEEARYATQVQEIENLNTLVGTLANKARDDMSCAYIYVPTGWNVQNK
ncbi:hypothetical protein [Jiella pelagia]|uniref:Uncharacterized protein n=1 Tax=Jiella pelagia TaxID=2986949 RepID=A0ABY7C5Q7_9HYPH|nr:hypothetical protein [Jiella pelagia]WAP70369.1 hypothetical protein OH818_10025 [Jiella pelagia]